MRVKQCIEELLNMGCNLRKIQFYTGLKEDCLRNLLSDRKVKVSLQQYCILNYMLMQYQKRKEKAA